MSSSSTEIRHARALVNGIRLYYLRAGHRGHPMLCLHGRWGRARTWSAFMRRYGDRYRVAAPDQRGHGLSDKPPDGYTAEDLAADARALLERLGLAPALVVGHSMGARVAAYLAALHPQSVVAVALLDETLRGAGALFADSHTGSDDDGLTASWPGPWPTRGEAVQFLRQRFPRETNVEYFSHSLRRTAGGYDFLFSRASMAAIGRSYEDWRPLLPKIRRPVLLVRAAESWCLPEGEAREMREALPDCTYAEIQGSDHAVYTDNPGDFYEAFDRWLVHLKR